jgi:hypothetical protein
MGTKQGLIAGSVENPAAVADAEQHARQDMAGLSARLAARLPHVAPSLAAAGALASGWLILRRLKRR